MSGVDSAVGAVSIGDLRRHGIALLALTKPRIVELLLVTTLPAMFLAERGVPPLALIVSTLVGGALTAGGANALNMVYDRDIDALMSRTERRPIVTGDVTPAAALVFALALEAGGSALLYEQAGPLAAALALSAAVFYVVVYTVVLKRRTRHNIVIGGAAGAAPVLVAWAAVTGHLGLSPWLLFALIFLWTPPHFWALAIRFKDDYGRAGVPMLPVVADVRAVADQIVAYAVLLGGVSVALAPVARLGPGYLAVAAVSSALFVRKAWGLRADPTPARALRVFRFSILYLTVVFSAVAVFALVGRL